MRCTLYIKLFKDGTTELKIFIKMSKSRMSMLNLPQPKRNQIILSERNEINLYIHTGLQLHKNFRIKSSRKVFDF